MFVIEAFSQTKIKVIVTRDRLESLSGQSRTSNLDNRTYVMKRNKILEHIDPEEAASSFVFPVELSEKQKKKVSNDLARARRNSPKQMSEEEKLSINLLQLRLQLEDYLANQDYYSSMRFGPILKRYLEILKKKRVDFAREIDIHETLLSQLINNHRHPNDSIVIRLELHSNKSIPAEYWFRLVEKERIHAIRTNLKLRKEEKAHVSNRIAVQIES